MANILKGAPAAAKINDSTLNRAENLKKAGITPTLAILRVGEKPDDIYYENSAVKRAATVGVNAMRVTLPAVVSQSELLDKIRELNGDDTVHGVLILMPLPRHIDPHTVRNTLAPEKDVDGITPGSMSGVYSGMSIGFAPCTAQSCVEILEHYNIPLCGKRVAVVGRSLVIGRPVSMLLMGKDATVTICHTKTENMPEITRNADIVVTATGKPKAFGASYFKIGQTVIDVGLNVDAEGKMCGDVDFDAVEPIVENITPALGGVGAVTTAVLLSHTVQAAEKQKERI